MNTLFVPSLGLPDCLPLMTRLADSIDFPIKQKVIWNNGIPGIFEEWRTNYPDWIIKDSPISNRGVAGSWNECAKWFSSEPNWILANEDCYFLPGQLRLICKCADNHTEEPIIYLNSSGTYYCFIWSLIGREQFGEFDENFWPAYYEDCDYRVRLQLGEKTNFIYALEGEHDPIVPHGKPQTGGIDYSAMINGGGLLNRAYWQRKWGSSDYEKAFYQTPYKDHRLDAKEWIWFPEERAKRWPLYETFMSQPTPSIYE